MLNLYSYIVCITAVLSTAAGCLPSGPVSRQKPGERPHHMMKKIPIHTGSLHNGLRYVINRTDIGDTVSVVAVVKAGSIYEQEHLGAGLSHFCEHIIHEGSTSSHSGKEYTRIVEKLGNHSNAYTSKDHTCYFITTTRDAWEDALTCLSEWLFDCRFTEEEFTREKGVILREIEKSESEPRRILSKGLYETMFNEHPARYPVLGYKEIFQTVTRDELYSYYKRMYVPQHIVISISGRVNVDRADRYVKECFSSVHPSRGSLPVLSREPRQMGERKRTIIHEIKGGYLSMGFRTVTLDHPDLFALDLLSGILSGGDTGRITYTIREKKALAAGIGSYSYTPIYDAGIFGIWAEADPEHIEQIEEEVWTVLRDIEKNGVSAEEVRRVKRQIESSCLDDLKTSEDRAMSFGRSHMWTSNPLFDMYYLENIQNVTAEEIRNICGKYLTQDNLTTAYLLPPGNAAAASGQKKSASVSKTVRTVMKNGITVLTRKCGILPRVNITVAMKAGSRIETGETAGISRLFAHMLLRGSQSYSRDEIITFFDGAGGDVHSSSGRNSILISAEIFPEDLDAVLEILSDALCAPLFPDDELSRLKKRTLQTLSSENDHWRTALANRFREAFYLKHPYGHNPKGTCASVDKITVRDLKSLYSQIVAGDNCIVSVYGDIPPDTAETVEKYFSAVPSPRSRLPRVAPEPVRSRSGERVFPGTGPHIAGIYVGFSGISYLDTQRTAVFDVIDAMISGVGYPGGWLHEKLRGERLVYVVHAFNICGIDPGHFGIYAGCDPSNVEKALEIISTEIGRLPKGDFSEKELDEARNLCILSEKMSLETPEQIGLKETLDAMYGLGYDFHSAYEERIMDVSREDIIKTAKEYLKHELTVITAPGKQNSAK